MYSKCADIFQINLPRNKKYNVSNNSFVQIAHSIDRYYKFAIYCVDKNISINIYVKIINFQSARFPYIKFHLSWLDGNNGIRLGADIRYYRISPETDVSIAGTD